jgi:hypothetical protein
LTRFARVVFFPIGPMLASMIKARSIERPQMSKRQAVQRYVWQTVAYLPI